MVPRTLVGACLAAPTCYCKISTGAFGTTIEGKILDTNENWIEIETRKGNQLINAEFVLSIKITD
ncbi:MAG: hypothetical protein ABRQ27_04495 [Clostridiaceae bacterium]